MSSTDYNEKSSGLPYGNPSDPAYPPAPAAVAPYPNPQGGAAPYYQGGNQVPPGYSVPPVNSGGQQVITVASPYGTTAPIVQTTTVIRQHPQGPMPNNYMILSILVFFFFSRLCGIIAIVFGIKVKDRWLMGDMEGAQSSSKVAFWWNITGLIIGTCLWITIIVLICI
ncbi:interferon-induced transmembrane protein 3-like [Diadema setosum]|uniref:interferon-induced transmembrane protein 3-like n=1 Tax=Diadema setosum TaxID=31175 RepID=UPI003B3A89FC